MSRLEDLARRRQAEEAERNQQEAEKARRERESEAAETRKKQAHEDHVSATADGIIRDMRSTMGPLVEQAHKIIGGKVENLYGENEDGRVYVRKRIKNEWEERSADCDTNGMWGYSQHSTGVDIVQYQDGEVVIEGAKRTARLRGRRARDRNQIDRALTRAVENPKTS